MKKIPFRTCIITKEKLEKKNLIRIVRTPDNKVIVDLTGKQNGHGAYLKKEEAVINQAERSQVLSKVLGIAVPNEIYEELRRVCDETHRLG